jgi:hypothetical protein
VSEVFISYSQPDRECAHEILARLEGRGLKCWIAPRDISPAADWACEIIDAISAARVMVLVFSGASNESPQVRREVERAVHKHVIILPFRIDDVMPSKSLEFFLSTQHWLDAFPAPRDEHYQRLVSHVETLVQVPPGAPPAAMCRTAASAPAAGFGARDLSHIERQLAEYIGPLAKHLVKRASLSASGLDDLITRLAGELDGAADRSAFTRRCRQPPSA